MSDIQIIDNNDYESHVNYKVGHRKRVRERFLELDTDNLSDYELLEMILFLVIPRIDVKPIAKLLLKQFGSLRQVFLSIKEDTRDIKLSPSIKKNLAYTITLISKIHQKLLISEVKQGTVIEGWDALISYLQNQIGHIKHEQFLTLYLDSRHRLIKSVEFGSGTIDESTVYVREIIKNALDTGSVNMILVHNHPSGNTTPSKNDIDLTTTICNAAKMVGIRVYDHIIISSEGYFSFRGNFLM